MRESKWNDELVEQLKDLYINQNLSTAEVANRLGFTKNAIIGKIHRMGLVKTTESKSSSQVKVIAKVNTGVVKKSQGTYKLEDLESNMCVWPYGDDDFTFCGNKIVPDKPYCEEHLALVYLPPKRMVRKRFSEIYSENDLDADMEAAEEDIEEDIDQEEGQ